ncbi:M4 family metallopeptidase [Spirosoma soli]|uniref:M4 family metallopeptidase n=1 Tax=Spirosoma soli TaxID=1770529 RepID=A0ABW5M798_9BACT
MKTSLLVLSVLLTSAALAQQPGVGFSRKLKTTAPTTGLAERLGATIIDRPKGRSGQQGLISTGQPKLTMEPLRLRVVRDSSTSLPIYIERKLTKRATAGALAKRGARLSAAGAATAAYQFMGQVRGLLKLNNPETSFAVSRTQTDELGQTHIRLMQTHRGIPVLGSELVAHLTDGDVTLLNGRYKPVPEALSTTPTLTLDQAAALALKDVGQTSTVVRSFGDNILKLKQSVGELCILPTVDQDAKLAYQVTVRPNMVERWEYVIDAQTGDILDKYNHTCTFAGPMKASGRDLNGEMRSFQTYQHSNNKYYMIDASRPMFNAAKSTMPDKPVGAIMTLDAKNARGNTVIKPQQIASNTNNDWNATAVSAHYNATVAYEYYKNTFNRNGLDGAGGTIISVINITDEDGKGLDNAFWNGEIMGYGNGKLLKPLAGALDAAGHEMTHGVIQSTAGLQYKGQSGAINESFADVFGAMIDRDDWTIGETIATPAVLPSGALRDLSNPNQGGKAKDPNGYQPATMAQYDNTTRDNGGVHINSGIANFAFYKFATAIGKDKAEKVYYRALTTYLVRTSQFLDLRLAIIKSAGDLFGATGSEVTAAKNAFDAVGITEDTQSNPGKQPDLPVASGKDLILLTDTEESKLFSTDMSVTPAKFDQKTTTSLLHRPSVTDDGQTAYYVSSDKRIRSVNLTGTPSEFVVSNETVWDNVAISKDGSKLAALTADRDGSIYVYSFTKKKWAHFKLHNPTYTEGVETSNVLYADSFEWDFSGENIVYDAYNAIDDNSGYWDVSFINVWNKKADDFADGNIERLFADLEDGESIGNPSFSKNSPDIIAFDYVNDIDQTYSIVAADLSVGKAKVVYENNTLGFPSYSRLDDKLVFSREADGSENVSGIVLGADKLSSTGEATVFYTGAKWPVWYTQATRNAPAKTAQTITFNTIADRYANQGDMTLRASSSANLPVSFQVRSGPATLTGSTLKFTGPGTVTVRAYQDGNNQFAAATPVDRTFQVLVVTSTEPTWADALAVYPNPANTSLTVELPEREFIEQLSIKTLTGATVLQPAIGARQRSTTLDIRQLPKGMYFLQIQTPNGVTNRKLVKE